MTAEAEYRPGLEDVPAAKSAVSFLDGKKAVLEYRGIPVEVLAKESCFEEVSWLLIKGELPTQKQLADFDHDLRQHRRHPLPAEGPDQVHARRRAPDGRPARARRGARHVLPVPDRRATRRRTGTRPAGSSPRCRRSWPRSPDAPRRGNPRTARPTSTTPATSTTCCSARSRRPRPRKVLDACLILHAEHTMNASTFTARVTGSTLANPYQTIASAIGSLSGPLHGGANEEVLRQFEEIGSAGEREGRGSTPSSRRTRSTRSWASATASTR